MVAQLQAARAVSRVTVRHQPQPLGYVVPGSAVDRVRKHLTQHADKWFARWQLLEILPLHQKAIDSALLVLRSRGAVVTRGDPRNPKWLQYAAAPDSNLRTPS